LDATNIRRSQRELWRSHAVCAVEFLLFSGVRGF